MNTCESFDHDIDPSTREEMESGPIDGVYYIPHICNVCGKRVFEEYEYTGIVEEKRKP